MESFTPQALKSGKRGTLMASRQIYSGALFLLIAVLFLARTLSAQQPPVTDHDVEGMITSAQSPAEHQALAAFFRQEAKDAERKADLHKHWADAYRGLNDPKEEPMIKMCDNMSTFFRKAAAGSEKLAQMHEQMAKASEPK